MQNTEIKEVVAADLQDYSLQVEKLVKEGYTFSDKNEYFPRMLGYAMYAWMLKEETSQEAPAKPVEAVAEDTQGGSSQDENKAATEPSKGVSKGRPKKV